MYHNVVYSIPCYRQDLKKNHKFDHKMVNRESTPFYRQEIKNHKIITNSCIEYTLQHAGIKKKHKLYNNQRLPGACNRSPGSKLLSITIFWKRTKIAVYIPSYIFGREPSNDYFIKILFLLSKWFQKRRFLWEFPIGSYVKLSSAVAAILVEVLKCRTVLEEDHPRIILAKFG